MTIDLRLGDCLDVMPTLEAGSIDLILADLPYGTTACKWDVVIPFEPLWACYRRLLKPRGAVVLTASQPFTSMLVMSNREWFKYCLVWDKELSGNPLNAPFQPLKIHEDVVVFSSAASTMSTRGTMSYNPQMEPGKPYTVGGSEIPSERIFRSKVANVRRRNATGERYPKSIIRISNGGRVGKRAKPHRTAKPVDLMEYLIRTYSNEGDTVLDNCFGSGTTGVACLRTGRKFVGIEKDAGYFNIGKDRLAAESARHPLLTGACSP